MATTGLQQQVFDKNGKATTIIFSSKSDPKALSFLSQLNELDGVYGTSSPENFRGIEFNQVIIIEGQLDPKILRTESAPNTAASEDYQEFVLNSIKVQFPLSRWVEKWGEEHISTHLETHFSFETLFPDGLKYKETEIDFSDYTAKASEVKAPLAKESIEKFATIPEFKIEGINIQEAVRKLNREIWKKYPGEFNLLVRYVERSKSNIRFDRKPLDLHLANDPPISVIVQYLTTKCYCQWGIWGPQGTGITIFAWPSQDFEGRDSKIETTTLPNFKVKNLNLRDAIRKLNREIRKKYNGELDLLVSYVESPGPPSQDKRPLNVSFAESTSVEGIVLALTGQSFCHYDIHDSAIVVYGWHSPQLQTNGETPKNRNGK